MRISYLCLCVLFLSGCASMPDIKLGYYLPKLDLKLTVTQVATCNDKGIPFLNNSIDIESKYSRDQNSYHQIDIGSLENSFTNSDITLEYHDDGRLQSINTTQSGQGLEIISAVIDAVEGVSPLSALSSDCGVLKSLLGKDEKVLAIKHVKDNIQFEMGGGSVELDQITLSDSDFQKVTGIFGEMVKLDYEVKTSENGICQTGKEKLCGLSDTSSSVIPITLKQPAIVTAIVSAGPDDNITNMDLDIPVPQLGTEYSLPIPKPPVFGANTFELFLTESGRISKIKYGKDTGVTQGVGGIASIRAATKSESVRTKADELKAKADLIKNEQRLIKCQANPSECE